MKRLPKNLDEAVSAIVEMMSSPKDQEYFKKAKDLSIYHTTLGRWIRNQWGLWGKDNPELKQWFLDKGITHPDDMSSIILSATQAKLNDTYFDLDLAIKSRKRYWEHSDEKNNVETKEKDEASV